MLCPEVVHFPPPKTITTINRSDTNDSVLKTLNMNSFYKSLVLTLPDEIQTPAAIEEAITIDSDFYRLTDCPLTEFVEPTFIESFVKKGQLFCLTANRNCMVDNCAAITPDGCLTLHTSQGVFQTLGLEGSKRPHNFYEVKFDLKTLKINDRIKQALKKLGSYELDLIWEPLDHSVCPSSIAKYFHDRQINITSESLALQHIAPDVTRVPSFKDVELDSMVEWIGMLALEADLIQEENYISTYYEPDSELSLETTRISVLIVRGFISPSLIADVCSLLREFSSARSLDNYWTAISVQSQENGLWQWKPSSPKMFQAHDSSFNVFFSRDSISTYSVGQIKYS